jgi:hypothetical protein
MKQRVSKLPIQVSNPDKVLWLPQVPRGIR